VGKRKKDIRFVPVQVDLLERIIEISKREGKPVSALIHEALEESIRVYEMKGSLREMVAEYELLKTLRETGAVIVPSSILYYSTEKLYRLDQRALLEKWYAAGQWYGRYLQAKFRGDDVIEVLRRFLSTCAWNITDLAVSNRDGEVEFQCIAPNLSMQNTELFSKYLEGIMDALGYELVRNDTIRGLVLMGFKRRERRGRLAQEPP